jgi:hypothetical protein
VLRAFFTLASGLPTIHQAEFELAKRELRRSLTILIGALTSRVSSFRGVHYTAAIYFFVSLPCNTVFQLVPSGDNSNLKL